MITKRFGRVFAALALLVLGFAGCEKEQGACKECTFVVGNGSEYPYKVSFFNWPGSPAPFTLQPGMVKSFQAPKAFPITIVGDYKSPFAHNDYKKSFYCPGDCGVVSVVLEP